MGSSQTEAHALDVDETGKPERPFLTVISGNPDSTQVAALTTVFAELVRAAELEATKQSAERNAWGNYDERLNRPVTYNPNAFRNVTFY